MEVPAVSPATGLSDEVGQSQAARAPSSTKRRAARQLAAAGDSAAQVCIWASLRLGVAVMSA